MDACASCRGFVEIAEKASFLACGCKGRAGRSHRPGDPGLAWRRRRRSRSTGRLARSSLMPGGSDRRRAVGPQPGRVPASTAGRNGWRKAGRNRRAVPRQAPPDHDGSGRSRGVIPNASGSRGRMDRSHHRGIAPWNPGPLRDARPLHGGEAGFGSYAARPIQVRARFRHEAGRASASPVTTTAFRLGRLRRRTGPGGRRHHGRTGVTSMSRDRPDLRAAPPPGRFRSRPDRREPAR